MRTAAAVVVATALVGCGSSKPSATASARAYALGVKYADCVRSRGVPQFPDPSPGGGFALRTSGINLASPAFGSAARACASLDPESGPRPPITAVQQAGMIANARCIRTHGAPDFPDPTFGPGGRGVGIDMPATLNTNAPALRAAAKACLHVGTLIPGVGVG
jgi:hypothetical protein